MTLPEPLSQQTARAEIDALNELARRQWRSNSAGALALCERAYRLAQEAAYPHGQAWSLEVRSRCRLRLADPEAALDDASAALEQFKALGDEAGTEAALSTFGIIALDQGHFEGALERSLALKEAVKNQKGQAETCILLGALLTQEGQLELALEQLHRALETAAAIASREVLAKAHDVLAKAYRRSGCFLEALTHYESCHKLRDELHSS